MLTKLRNLRFGYVPYRADARSAGDRRRFPLVASRLGLQWEVYQEGGEYDVILVTANADLTSFNRWTGKEKLIFELIDSYMDVPDWDLKSVLRGTGKWLLRRHRYLQPFFRQSLKKMAQRADLILCSTCEQRESLKEFNSNIHPILDIMDELVPLPGKSHAPEGGPYELLWEGQGLISLEFQLLQPVLKQLSEELPLRLHLVTDTRYKKLNLPWVSHDVRAALEKRIPGVEFYVSEWNPTSLRSLAQSCHAGLIPLPLDKPLYRSKPENKLRLLWGLRLPTVTSATVAYERCMSAYGGPYWACRNLDDWYRCLRVALTDTAQRDLAIEKSSRFIGENYSAEILLSKWESALSTLV